MSEGAPEHGHADLDLSHKIGPLSIGQWLLALGGVVGITWYLRKRSATAATTATTDAGANTDTNQGIGDLAGATGTTATDTQTAGVATNQSWLSTAEAALAGTGADAYTVDQTLLAYLSGTQLNPTQQSLFDKAVQLAGPVPIPVASMPGTEVAATGVPTPPTTQTSTVPPSSTLGDNPIQVDGRINPPTVDPAAQGEVSGTVTQQAGTAAQQAAAKAAYLATPTPSAAQQYLNSITTKSSNGDIFVDA